MNIKEMKRLANAQAVYATLALLVAIFCALCGMGATESWQRILWGCGAGLAAGRAVKWTMVGAGYLFAMSISELRDKVKK